MSDNMRHWDNLCETDPKFTKKVSMGGGFSLTTICAQWQRQRMTEEFGPVGVGWKYVCDHSIIEAPTYGSYAVCDVTIGIKEDSEWSTWGPIRGMAPFVVKNRSGEFFDKEAPKKAMTDALTKGMSDVGLSADVFLGKFDSSPYVNEMKAKFDEKAPEKPVKAETPVAPPTEPTEPRLSLEDMKANYNKGLDTTAQTFGINPGDVEVHALVDNDLMAKHLKDWTYEDFAEGIALVRVYYKKQVAKNRG